MESQIGAGHGPGDADPHKVASHAGRDSSVAPTRPTPSGGEEAAADQGPESAAVYVDRATMKLIRRYATPDRNGWLMPPADMLYRLTHWHGVRITRVQLTEVLRAEGYYRSAMMP